VAVLTLRVLDRHQAAGTARQQHGQVHRTAQAELGQWLWYRAGPGPTKNIVQKMSPISQAGPAA
jgi:hypothetical protein